MPLSVFWQVVKKLFFFFAYCLKKKIREKKNHVSWKSLRKKRVEPFQINKTFCLTLTNEGKKKKITLPSSFARSTYMWKIDGEKKKNCDEEEKIIVVTPHPRIRSIVTHTNIRKLVHYFNQYSESSQRKKNQTLWGKFRYPRCNCKWKSP